MFAFIPHKFAFTERCSCPNQKVISIYFVHFSVKGAHIHGSDTWVMWCVVCTKSKSYFNNVWFIFSRQIHKKNLYEVKFCCKVLKEAPGRRQIRKNINRMVENFKREGKRHGHEEAWPHASSHLWCEWRKARLYHLHGYYVLQDGR